MEGFQLASSHCIVRLRSHGTSVNELDIAVEAWLDRAKSIRDWEALMIVFSRSKVYST